MYFYYKTARGVVSIVQRLARWHVIFQDEDLGGYVSAHQAAMDVAGGHTFLVSSGTDLGRRWSGNELGCAALKLMPAITSVNGVRNPPNRIT